MPTFQYPVMAQGLAGGVDAFTRNFLAMQKLRQDQAAQMAQQGYLERGLAMQEARAARETAEAERISAARLAVPGNIATLMAPIPGTPAVAEQGWHPESEGGYYTPAVPAGPERSPGFTNVVSDPQRFLAAQQLTTAGVPAFDIVGRADEARRHTQREERDLAAMNAWKTAGPLLMSDNREDRRKGLALAYQGAVQAGHFQGATSILDKFKDERDAGLNDEFLRKGGSLLGKGFNNALTAEENSELLRILWEDRSPVAAEIKKPVMNRIFTGAAATLGTGWPAIRAFYLGAEVDQATGKTLSPVERWRRIEQDPRLSPYAALARKEKTVPPQVLEAEASSLKAAEAKAGETPARKQELEARAAWYKKRAEDVGKEKKGPKETITLRTKPITDTTRVQAARQAVSAAEQELARRLPSFRDPASSTATLPAGEVMPKTEILRRYLEKYYHIHANVEWDAKTKTFVLTGPISEIVEETKTTGSASRASASPAADDDE